MDDDEVLEEIERQEVTGRMLQFLSETRNGLVTLGWTATGAEHAAVEIWTTSMLTQDASE